jgi:hypothetical protein
VVARYASTDYPQSFPCPDRDSYSISLDSGLVRDNEAYPLINQNRVNKHFGTFINVTFTVLVKELFIWQAWVNENGYSWFNMNIAHPFMPKGFLTEKVPVKFANEVMSIRYADFAHVRIGALLELSPVVFAESAL